MALVRTYIARELPPSQVPLPRTGSARRGPIHLFKEEVRAGNVEAIYSQGDTVEGRFENPVTYPPKGEGGSQPDAPPSRTSKTFTTVLPSFVDPGLEELLIDNGVEISAEPIQEGGGLWQTLLFAFGPALLLIGGYIWLYRRAQQQGGGMGGALTSVGRSRARRYDKEQNTKVTFDDVAGIEEAENELVEIVDFLMDPEKYTRLGGAAPKGVLLVGAPGTGKTLLARAVAGEAGVPFFSLSASEFVELFVGVGASRVRDLFKQARENAPAIIFIDEIDSIGRTRGQAVVGGSSEQEQTLNQILTEMDGFSSKEGVIVLAATNQPDVLDKALLRPGRFDRRVTVNLPDKAGREAILKVHTRSVPLADNVDLGELASSTPGLSGADLRNLVNEAALLAARREQEEVRQKDFLDALEKIVLGPERPLLVGPQERERIAYHEGGHAILGLVVPGADPVNRVTIVPRGQALGVTYQRPEDDRYNYPEGYLRARIIGALGGRVAEEIVYGTRTTGCRKRHRASYRSCKENGHPLGNEREAGDGRTRAPRKPLPRERWLSEREALQRGDRPHRGLRGTPDHRRMPRRGPATPDRTSQGARGARPSPVGAGDPRRRGNPGGHGPPARTATGEQEGPCPGRRRPRVGDRRPLSRKARVQAGFYDLLVGWMHMSSPTGGRSATPEVTDSVISWTIFGAGLQ